MMRRRMDRVRSIKLLESSQVRKNFGKIERSMEIRGDTCRSYLISFQMHLSLL
jgi:hypothetical protein